jgi:predicted Rossmann fold flavoprotein
MGKAVEIYDVIVIGGGASGMMAAGTAGARGKRVLLLEKNKKLGEKLRISGGGRCNITNAEQDQKALLAHFGDAEQFLYSSFSQFGVADTFTFFESRGLPLKIEAHKRAFPITEDAEDVCKTLVAYMARHNVQVRTGVSVTDVQEKRGRIQKIVAGSESFTTGACILATGGVSHPETGSTGDGFSMLAKLGHHIVPPTPTIVPLKTKEKWARALSGVSLPGMKITFFVNQKKQFSLTGTVLFTHFGISGPLILNAAGKVADLLHVGEVTARIDARPESDVGILDRDITKVFDANKNKLLKNVWKEIAPAGTAEVLSTLLPDIDFETKHYKRTASAYR